MSNFAFSIYDFSMNSSEIKHIFTENLRKYRLINKMTQMQLAEAADLSVGFLCDLESGKKWGTLETMAKLANALHIKPYQLLMAEEEKNTTVNIYEDLSNLSENLKKSIETNIRDLIQKYADH